MNRPVLFVHALQTTSYGVNSRRVFSRRGEIVGGEEVDDVLPQLFVRLVMVALDGRLLDRPVHSFDLAVRPRWRGLKEFDIEIGAGQFEKMAEERQFLRPHLLDVVRRPAVARGIGEVRPLIGKHRVNSIWHGRGEAPQEVGSNPACGFLGQLNESELRRPVGSPPAGTACLARFAPRPDRRGSSRWDRP